MLEHILDFTNCKSGFRKYGGSENKISIAIDDKKYMLKLPEHKDVKLDMQTSSVNNVFSEYVGSHIMQSTGLHTHNTLLGVYKGKPAVACEDFTDINWKLHEFSWFMREMYDSSEIGRIPTYLQINYVMEHHPMLSPIFEDAIDRYWDTIVVDALIGNFDRHKDNFGFLVNEQTGEIKLAPIYDCGSCLYPGLSEEAMEFVLNSEEEINKRIFEFPVVALAKDTTGFPRKVEKYSYQEILFELPDTRVRDAILRMYDRIDTTEIHRIVDETPFLTELRKQFYKTMLDARKEKLLDVAYHAAKGVCKATSF